MAALGSVPKRFFSRISGSFEPLFDSNDKGYIEFDITLVI